MGLLERVVFFHQEIVIGKYPNSKTLVNEFEISPATAKRDINYLRDRLLAPLTFHPQKNGYYYSKEGFNLPFEQSPKIVFLIAMLNKLAGEIGLGKLPEVQQLEERLSTMLSPDYETLIDSLYCEWIEVEAVDHRIFATVTEAIARKKNIHLRYRSPTGKKSTRDVAPEQIINYQGRWYLRAYCNLRHQNRLFHMARIQTARLTRTSLPKTNHATDHLGQSFGIFSGRPRYRAKILFTSTAAELVRNQYWHRDQLITEVEDGVQLLLPVSDDREIIMKILQYGPMARVLSPPELVARVHKEITAMAQIYPAEP